MPKERVEGRFLRQMAYNNLVHSLLYLALAVAGVVAATSTDPQPNTFQFHAALITMTTFFLLESPLLFASFVCRLSKERNTYNVFLLNLVRTALTIVRYCLNIWLIAATIKTYMMGLGTSLTLGVAGADIILHVIELGFFISVFLVALLRPIVCFCI